MYKRLLCAGALAIVSLIAVSAHDATYGKSKVTLVYDKALPNVPGTSLRAMLVDYGPGGFSPAHTHPASAFVYALVLEGAVRSQVNDGPVFIYRAGESFSEYPGDRHDVSENASATKPARLLAVFIVATDETDLTIPASTANLAVLARTEGPGEGD